MSGPDVRNPSLDEQLVAFGVVRNQLIELYHRHTGIMAKVGEIETEIEAAESRQHELRVDIFRQLDAWRAAL